MGRELAEGKVHALERAAALAKGFGDDMRRQYAALETHAHALDRENEELQACTLRFAPTLHNVPMRPLTPCIWVSVEDRICLVSLTKYS